MNNKNNNLLTRSVGSWTSIRQYYYFDSDTILHTTTTFDVVQDGSNTKVVWLTENDKKNNKAPSNMILTVANNNKLIRSRGYLKDIPTESIINKLTEDELSTTTSYDGFTFNETITFIDDNTRVRQNIGTVDKDGSLYLVGHYVERRSSN